MLNKLVSTFVNVFVPIFAGSLGVFAALVALTVVYAIIMVFIDRFNTF